MTDMSMHTRVLVCLSLIVLINVGPHVTAQQVKGIQDQPPAKGIFVKVGDRYMVPYMEKIPGTDVTFEMIPVRGGTFLMGSPADEPNRKTDEGPQVRVRVAPMWVGKHEVTQAEYREFELLYEIFVEIAQEPGARQPSVDDADVVSAPTQLYDPDMTYQWGEGPNHPAVTMTQFAAQQYTKWLSAITKNQYRLPIEAEWEYACRAGSKTRFSWGDSEEDADKYAWFFENSDDGFSVVGKKLPNAFGIHDMHGNVAEWTVNSYSADGYADLSKKKQPINAIETVHWPEVSSGCVVRGGIWEYDSKGIRCAARLASDDEAWKQEDPMFPTSPWWYTSDPATSVGFRLFRSYEPLDKPTISKFWDHTSPEVREYVADFLNWGRGKIGILDENLVPASIAYRVQRAKNLEWRRKERERIRAARPNSE